MSDDENSFVWIRRFEDVADRQRVLDAVHQDPRCASIVATVSALTDGMASTIRLNPTPWSGLR
ncbi:NIPSNAP family protein [Actinacidiphila sp. DG2A-62]|uniref:NIPSNAP family protein n=1 Tax=Actinacidiphila sp. DG2A-62 TaxID=3108821 RepID=UPI002DBE13D4|nr:NIPSNAP family protein [Actinacidiphila sp. DG2A-62]MEC3997092.1 NIPSNAP family protein [Actinacidiphila sp. DG2A-62]